MTIYKPLGLTAAVAVWFGSVTLHAQPSGRNRNNARPGDDFERHICDFRGVLWTAKAIDNLAKSSKSSRQPDQRVFSK